MIQTGICEFVYIWFDAYERSESRRFDAYERSESEVFLAGWEGLRQKRRTRAGEGSQTVAVGKYEYAAPAGV